MGYFPVRYNSRVVIYEHKMFIRSATGANTSYEDNIFYLFVRMTLKIRFIISTFRFIFYFSLQVSDANFGAILHPFVVVVVVAVFLSRFIASLLSHFHILAVSVIYGPKSILPALDICFFDCVKETLESPILQRNFCVKLCFLNGPTPASFCLF